MQVDKREAKRKEESMGGRRMQRRKREQNTREVTRHSRAEDEE